MNVVNTLLAVARRAKDCGMAADIDAPPKIANAFIGLEEKFGKKFDHTSKVPCEIFIFPDYYFGSLCSFVTNAKYIPEDLIFSSYL